MMKLPIAGGLAIVALVAGVGIPQPAEASTLRCGVHLIQGGGRHGPTSFEVLRKCGEPAERRAYTWLYRQGGSKWELRFSSEGILETVTQR